MQELSASELSTVSAQRFGSTRERLSIASATRRTQKQEIGKVR
jgi:hypothetical protein